MRQMFTVKPKEIIQVRYGLIGGNAPDTGAKCKKDIVWQVNSTAELFRHRVEGYHMITHYCALQFFLDPAIGMIALYVGKSFYVCFSSADF